MGRRERKNWVNGAGVGGKEMKMDLWVDDWNRLGSWNIFKASSLTGSFCSGVIIDDSLASSQELSDLTKTKNRRNLALENSTPNKYTKGVFMTLEERIRDIVELFSLRNAMYMSNDDKRLRFLLDTIRRLGKLIRSGELDRMFLGNALASVFARTCAFADILSNLPIVDALCEKYPIGKCAYCQNLPCSCEPHKRKGIAHASVSETQKLWGVNDWCRHMDEVYGDNNRKRGILYAQSRLTEEVCEVVSAQLIEINDRTITLEQVRQKISREFADVFAWIFSLSSLFQLGAFDSILESRYPRVHRRCGMRPCNCGPFYLYANGDILRIPGESTEGPGPFAETRVGE